MHTRKRTLCISAREKIALISDDGIVDKMTPCLVIRQMVFNNISRIKLFTIPFLNQVILHISIEFYQSMLVFLSELQYSIIYLFLVISPQGYKATKFILLLIVKDKENI